MAQDAVAEIRDRIDIVDLVQEYVPDLKRAGRSYKGLCPFHQEKTPSFVVFSDSQNFHCFGCGKGGDLFTFYMLTEGVEFREALRDLAAKAGVELQQGVGVTPKHDEHRTKLVEINDLAATFFHHILTKAPHGEAGRQMLKDRGVSDEMVDRFRLGFAPDSWDSLLNFLSSRSIDVSMAEEAGLIQPRKSGEGHYDRFRNRFMFPIRNRDGEVVGFGGRAIGDGTPKYLNSPQTSIFDKSSIVYGLDLARESIRKTEEVVIVEGYMDVIAAHQFGYENAVAAMGTALTEQQIALVRRGAKRIVMALDADAAGQMATLRGLETMTETIDRDDDATPNAFGLARMERKHKTEIAIAQMPVGKDPDEVIREQPMEWEALIKHARPFLDFTIDLLTDNLDMNDARAKSEAVHRIAPLFRQITDRVVQAHYIGVLARKLRLDERLVLSEIRRSNMAGRERALRDATAAKATIDGRSRERTHENYLTALLLRHHQLTTEVLAMVPLDDIHDARNRAILQTLRDEDVAGMTAEQVVVALDDDIADHAEYLLASLEGRPEQFPGQIKSETTQILANLGRERFSYLLRQLQESLREAERQEDQETVRLLKTQLAQLAERHRTFYPPVSPYFKDSRSPAF
ncbi:MAG TPA: DNA primase [Thermomicrobiales bacterium]|nr:DNA primase [Thermomicrobiales bacterium]